MNRKKMRGYYWRMIHQLLNEYGVPKEEKKEHSKNIHELLKDLHGINSSEDLSDEDFHNYLMMSEIELMVEFGLGANQELKF